MNTRKDHGTPTHQNSYKCVRKRTHLYLDGSVSVCKTRVYVSAYKSKVCACTYFFVRRSTKLSNCPLIPNFLAFSLIAFFV